MSYKNKYSVSAVLAFLCFILSSPLVLATTSFTKVTSTGSKWWSSIASSGDGTHVFAVEGGLNGVPGDIWTSADSGATWIDVTSTGSAHNQLWMSITSDITGQYLAAVVNNGDIWTSNNYGVNWTNQTVSVSSMHGLQWVGVASDHSGQHYTAIARYYHDLLGRSPDINGGVWISSNAGVTWTQTSASTTAEYTSIASSSDGTKLIAGATHTGVYISHDGGTTWTLNSDSDILGDDGYVGVASNADGRVLVLTSLGNYLYLSTDYGSTWIKETSLGVAYWQGVAVSADGSKIAASIYGGSSFLSTNSGASFTALDTPFYSVQEGCLNLSANGANLFAGNLNDFIYYITVPTISTISTISPIAGATAGGTSVTITGTYLSGATVTVGGSAATIVSTSSNSITMTTPALSAGARDVIVTTSIGSVIFMGSFTYVAPPVATSLVAGTSNLLKGNSTTLTPTYSAGTATINGVTGLIVSGTPVTVSPTVTTIYTLTVTNSLGATATIASTITVIPSPTLTFANSSPSSLVVGSTLTDAVSSSLSGGSYGSIAYISSNTSIATVNASGVVTAVGAGTATITALQYASDGNNSSAAASYPITVTAPVIPVTPVALVSAGISITNTTQTYTGQPLPVTVTTSPSNLTAAITYSPGFTTPTEAGTYYVLVNISGSSSYYGSQSSVLTILPASQSVSIITPAVLNVGVPVNLSATSKSNGPIVFSLVSGNATLSGSTLTALDTNLIVVKATQAGTNDYQTATATLNLTALQIKPVIVIQPIAAINVNQGGSTTLSVTGSSNLGNTYQWYINNAAITGATSSAYTLTNAQLTNAGNYTIIISNAAGSVTSTPTILSVLTPPTITTQPSNQVALNGSSSVLSVSSSGAISTFQWYLNGSAIAGANSSNYIIPSVDSTNIGSYTVRVTNSAGTVTSNAATVSLATGTLVNLSDLGLINSSNTSYTTGFVISQGNETVLIRAVGPVLSTLGVTGVLTQPQLQLFDSLGKVIATNTAWGTSAVKGDSTASATIVPVTNSLMASAGAFSLPAGSNDCALIVNLPPGQYTAQVTALNVNSGKVMVEVYQVPNQ